MVYSGNVIGRQSYSFRDERTGRLVEGMIFYVSRDAVPANVEGLLVDRLSFSMRDLPSDIPKLNDHVQYSTYKESGKIKSGYILWTPVPIDQGPDQ